MYYHSEQQTEYSKPILNADTVFVLSYIFGALSLLSLLLHISNQYIAVPIGVFSTPMLFSIFMFIGLAFLGYGIFSTKYRKLPSKYINQLLEYTQDIRLHRTILKTIRSNKTIYIGDLVKISKAVDIACKQQNQYSIDLYLQSGGEAPELADLDRELAVIRSTQAFLHEVRYYYLIETGQQFAPV